MAHPKECSSRRAARSNIFFAIGNHINFVFDLDTLECYHLDGEGVADAY